jgi:hypothetical protein
MLLEQRVEVVKNTAGSSARRRAARSRLTVARNAAECSAMVVDAELGAAAGQQGDDDGAGRRGRSATTPRPVAPPRRRAPARSSAARPCSGAFRRGSRSSQRRQISVRSGRCAASPADASVSVQGRTALVERQLEPSSSASNVQYGQCRGVGAQHGEAQRRTRRVEAAQALRQTGDGGWRQRRAAPARRARRRGRARPARLHRWAAQVGSPARTPAARGCGCRQSAPGGHRTAPPAANRSPAQAFAHQQPPASVLGTARQT